MEAAMKTTTNRIMVECKHCDGADCREIHDVDGLVVKRCDACAFRSGKAATTDVGDGLHFCDKCAAELAEEALAARKHGPLFDCGEFPVFVDADEPTTRVAAEPMAQMVLR